MSDPGAALEELWVFDDLPLPAHTAFGRSCPKRPGFPVQELFPPMAGPQPLALFRTDFLSNLVPPDAYGLHHLQCFGFPRTLLGLGLLMRIVCRS